MALSPAQQANINIARQRLKKRGQPLHGRVAKSLIEAMGVEPTVPYVPTQGGDRDSSGVLQQRPSQGWGPATDSVATDIDQYLARAVTANQGFKGSAGMLAQAVQRSAYPERYDQQGAKASAILGSSLAPQSTRASRITTSPGVVAGTSQATPQQPSVYDVIRQYRANTSPTPGQNPEKSNFGSSPYNPAASGQQIQGTVDQILAIRSQTQAAMQSGDAVSLGANNPDTPVALAQMIQEADQIDRAQVPYLLGGGHAGPARGTRISPLDCSGAVSRVLGIDPRVSGAFTKWGESGHGRAVTIYANGEHVLMEINGHFFGTSGANPQGGPGWIPRTHISKDYLSRFTARHPRGL